MDSKETSTRVNSQQALPAGSDKPEVSGKNGHKERASNLPGIASRRSFMKRAGGLAAVAAMVPLEPLLGGKETQAEASVITYAENTRANLAFAYRKQEAQAEKISPP